MSIIPDIIFAAHYVNLCVVQSDTLFRAVRVGDNGDSGDDVPSTMSDGDVPPSGSEVIAAARQSIEVVTNDAHSRVVTTTTTDRMTAEASTGSPWHDEKRKSNEEQLTQGNDNMTDVSATLQNSTEGFL